MCNFFLKKFLVLSVLILLGFVFIVFTKTDVFFSPQDNIEEKLINHIDSTKKRIYVAIYMLTDKKIAQSLIDAKKRGVDVQVVTDQSCFDSEFGKIKLLQANGITIFVFKAHGNKNKYQNELMHNKFALLDNKICTGSFNWTISANVRNQENIVFMEDEVALQKYETKFEELKRICVCHECKPKPEKKDNRRMYYAYQKLVDKTVGFLKGIRDTLTSP